MSVKKCLETTSLEHHFKLVSCHLEISRKKHHRLMPSILITSSICPRAWHHALGLFLSHFGEKWYKRVEAHVCY